MASRSRYKKNSNHITRNTPPELKMYKMSNTMAVLMGLIILIVASGFFLASIFCERVAQSIWIRPWKMIASLYMALLGGLASMVTLRVTPTNTEYKIERWERIWRRWFLVITACIGFASVALDDRWWEVAQFYGYAVASYFVGCWMGTDTRKPKER